MQKFVKGYMADNNIKIQKQIQAYRNSNPKLKSLSDEQVASVMIKSGVLKLTEEQKKTLFPKKNTATNKGTAVEKNNSGEKSITLKSGRKILIKNGQTHYYAADGVELSQKYFEKTEGKIDVKPSGRYSVTKNGQTKYYAVNGTELKASYFNQVENPDVKIKSQDGKTYNFNKTLEKRINNVSANLKKAEDENGFIGKTWSGFKNLTGIGDSSDKVREQQTQEKKLLAQFNSNPQNRAKIFEQLTGQKYTNENLEKFIKGEIKLKSEMALQGYKEGQEMAVDVGADIVSGIAAVGIYSAAVAAAPFTGGASIAVGVAAAGVSGAAIKTGLKAADAATGGRKYSLKDAGHDAATGAFSGVIAPITGGMGGAVGKTVATKLGIQAVKTVGKEVAEEVVETGVKQGLKQGIKTALTNPTGYEYVGGNIAKRGAAMAAEMASDGAVGGAVDNAFRTALDGGNLSEIGQAAGDGFVGGLIISPVIGGGFKASGKIGHKIGEELNPLIPFGKAPKDVPQIVVEKKSLHDLYPASDAVKIAKMKERLKIQSDGTEDIELNEITGKQYKKQIETEKTREKFCFDKEGKDLPVGAKYTVIETMNDGDYRIFKATQSGSNPGFWVEHTGSGDLYYFKTGNGLQNVTEHVSSQLYRAAGIDTPEMNLIAGPGFDSNKSLDNCWIKSRAVADLKPISDNPKSAYEGFAVDAWLANWDAVCSGNTLIKDGNAVRVDFGGTFDFRARGARKKFGNEVIELSSLIDTQINPESAKIFQGMTREDLIASLKRVQSVTKNDIDKIYDSVKMYMNPELFTTLQNRQKYLGFILREAESTPIKPEQTIQDYVKFLENKVSSKYKKHITKMNNDSEQRSRIMGQLKKERDEVMSDEDLTALWKYKSSSYTANTCIQQGMLNDPLVTSLDKALEKTELPESITLFRGDHLVIDSHTNLRYKNDLPDDFNIHKNYYYEYVYNEQGELIDQILHNVNDNNLIIDPNLKTNPDELYVTKTISGKKVDVPLKMEDIIKLIFKKGKIVEEQQFVSTTINPNVARNFGKSQSDIIYKFNTPKGTKGTCPENIKSDIVSDSYVGGYLRGIDGIEGSESEILLKRGFKYKMKNLTFENGHWVIECDILN